MLKHVWLISVISAMGAMVYGSPELPKRGVVMELWSNVKTGQVTELVEVAKKRPADAIFIKNNIDENETGADNFGARYTALLLPPATGEYTFYLAADDTAELWLSHDEQANNLRKICEVRSYMPRHHFVAGKNAGSVKLQKGKSYYLMVNYKEAINGDHVALAWQGPDISKQIIAKKYLKPQLNGEQYKKWEQTYKQEMRSKELLSELRQQKVADLMPWLESLTQADRNALDFALLQVQSKAAGLPAPKRQKRLAPYARVAGKIKASPALPVHHPVAKTLLRLEAAWLHTFSNEELVQLGAHRLASSLGSIPKSAKLVKSTPKLSSRGDKWREELVSLGLYAAPGKLTTVEIPAEYVGKGLEMQVGHHFPEKKRPFISMPDTTRRYKLDKATTSFVTPHGGLMLLKVPKQVELRDTPIRVDGAMKAPRFVLGKHTDADWETLKKAPAPWGELVSEHVVLVVPRETLLQLTNPTAVMTWWNENCRDLEDFFSYYPGVPFRMHAGLYAEEGVSFWPLQWEPKNMAYLLNLEAMQKKNSALFLHEHGHHCDFWEMELSFWGESTTNWGGYYLKARPGKAFDWKDSHDVHLRRLFDTNDKGMQEIMQDKWYKISTKGTHHWSYPITSMMIGYAEDFGWQCIKAVIKRLRDKKDEMYSWSFVQGADGDQAKIDRYLIGLSQAAKRDVRPYFAHFKMFPSMGAAKYLNALRLPKWDLTYYVQPEVLCTPKNASLSLPVSAGRLLSFAKRSQIQWVPTSAKGGKVAMMGKGDAVYTPPTNFTGTDVVSYVLSNQYGKTVEKQLQITVE